MAKQGKKTTPADTVSKQKIAPAAAPKSVIPVADFFDKLGNRGWMVAAGLIVLVGFIVFKDYLLREKVYLFKDIGSDTLNGLYPYVYFTARQFQYHVYPTWSFNWGMGQDTFPTLLHDPFDFFLFLAGKDQLAYHMVYKEVAKVILGGLAFFFYLRTLKLSNYTSVFGSLLFAFCAFMIVGGGWYYHSFEAFNVAVLLLSFELLFVKKKWQLFPFAIFLTCISMPFDLYIYAVFLTLYALLRCFQSGITDFRSIARLFLTMMGLGVIALLAGAPFLIQDIYLLLESPRGSGNSSYTHLLASSPIFVTADNVSLGTGIMRFFSSDMLGSGKDFKGWGNLLEAPMFYCGIPCLILMPQVFQFLEKRVKITFIIFLTVWVLPIVFPYFRYAFWLFTGDYYRAYSFFVAFAFMYYSLQAFEFITHKHKISLITLIVTIVVLLILLNLPLFPDRDIVNSALLVFAVAMLFVYGALLYFMSRENSSPYLKYVFLAAVVFELAYFSGITVNERDTVSSAELSEKVGFNDYSVEALKFIQDSDHSFYRVDKTYASSPAMHYSLNDGMAQAYNGTSSYNSFNQGKYVNFLELMGIIDKSNETQTRWAMGLINRPILESENRVKYMLVKKNFNPIYRVVCDSMATFGDVEVLRNKFTLPVGFTYHYYIREGVFNTLSSAQKDFVSLRTCVLSDEDVKKASGLTEFQLKDTISASAFSLDLYRQYANELSKDTLAVSAFGDRLISGKINSSEDEMLYLSVPYDGGWYLTVDGAPTEKIVLDDGMTGVMLKKGSHNIEMKFSQRHFSESLWLTLVGILAYAGLWVMTGRSKRKIEPPSSAEQA